MDSSQPDEMKQSTEEDRLIEGSFLLSPSPFWIIFVFFFLLREEETKNARSNLHIVMLRDTLPGGEGGILEMW